MSETTQALTVDQAASALTDFFGKGPSKEDTPPVESPEVEEEHVEDVPDGSAPEEDTSPADEDEDEVPEEDEEDDSKRTSFDEDEFEITVDGKPVTVKGAELKSGYMRHSDYTKKTQEVATERKALAAKQTEVLEQANIVKFQAHTKLEQFNSAIQQAGGWEKLRQNYPAEQVEQFTQMYVNAQKEAGAADAIIEQYTGELREQNSKAIAQIFEDMSHTIHGFNSGTLAEMDSYLTKNGFNTEMALAITHPQAWEMIYKAMRYDQAQARSKGEGKEKTQEGKKHHSAPATPVPQKSTASRRIDRATERLKEANKTRDRSIQNNAATDAIAELLKASQKRGK